LAQRLKDFRNEPDYRRFLLSCIEEGINNLPGNAFEVELKAEDQAFLEAELESMAGRLDAKIDVTPSAALDGGARIYTADRRLLIDNTFSARLKRAEEEIRREIWRTIFGTERSTPQ
jgi:vacuolar-type H+-ATPase subunit E/Vma4